MKVCNPIDYQHYYNAFWGDSLFYQLDDTLFDRTNGQLNSIFILILHGYTNCKLYILFHFLEGDHVIHHI